MTFYIELDSNPTGTAQQSGQMVRGGQIHHYIKKNVRAQKDIYALRILEALEDIGREPPHYEGPVFLSIHFYFSIKQKKRWGEWKDSRPDVDNMAKGLIDVLTKVGMWTDDSQICQLHLSKSYAEKPGIYFEMGRLINP